MLLKLFSISEDHLPCVYVCVFSLQQMSLNNKLSRMDAVLSTSKREYKIAIEQTETDNTLVTSCLNLSTLVNLDLIFRCPVIAIKP